jgi:hypothetical protein
MKKNRIYIYERYTTNLQDPPEIFSEDVALRWGHSYS